MMAKIAFDRVQDFRIIIDGQEDGLAHRVDDSPPVNASGSGPLRQHPFGEVEALLPLAQLLVQGCSGGRFQEPCQGLAFSKNRAIASLGQSMERFVALSTQATTIRHRESSRPAVLTMLHATCASGP